MSEKAIMLIILTAVQFIILWHSETYCIWSPLSLQSIFGSFPKALVLASFSVRMCLCLCYCRKADTVAHKLSLFGHGTDLASMLHYILHNLVHEFLLDDGYVTGMLCAEEFVLDLTTEPWLGLNQELLGLILCRQI